jgi:hypothetical protein
MPPRGAAAEPTEDVKDTNSANRKLLYRRKEAAFALGFSVRAIDYAIANGQLSARRYGGCVHIPAADVKKLAEEILAGATIGGASVRRN